MKLCLLRMIIDIADHDFTKLKLTPSVVQLCDIPDTIDKSFYSGRIFVTLKDNQFQDSVDTCMLEDL